MPRRVFLSHTSELRHYPKARSFVAACESAILRAGDIVSDMAYFAARDEYDSNTVRSRVAQCDVYVGIIGFRYGPQVRDEPDISYTELEYRYARQAELPRLLFLLSEDAEVPLALFTDREYGDRQQGFRSSLMHDSITSTTFRSPDELEIKLFQALVSLELPSRRAQQPPASSTTEAARNIFISHATSDRVLVDEFASFLMFAGVSEESIYYSSQRSTGTPTGAAFVEDLKRQLQNSVLVIQIITETYLMQPYCLAELGAQWALGLQSFPIAVPPVTAKEVSGLLAGVQVSPFSDETIDELFDTLVSCTAMKPNRRLWSRAYNRTVADISALVARLPDPPLVPREELEAAREQIANLEAQVDLLRRQSMNRK